MKKLCLIVFTFAAAAFFAHSASAQSYSAPINGNRERAQRAPAPVYREKAVGAFVRGARGGNPIQLLNPRAPQRYRGAHEDTVVAETSSTPQRNLGENPNRYAAVVLFGIRW